MAAPTSAVSSTSLVTIMNCQTPTKTSFYDEKLTKFNIDDSKSEIKLFGEEHKVKLDATDQDLSGILKDK